MGTMHRSSPRWSVALCTILSVVSACSTGTGDINDSVAPITDASSANVAEESLDAPIPETLVASTTSTSISPPAIDTIAGSWERVPTTLSGSELVPIVVPFGERVFILYTQNSGSEVAGEIYDPSTGMAVAMAPSEQGWRYNPAVAWTGTELLMVGGSSGPINDDLTLAYDPAVDEWRTLSNPPDAVDPFSSIGGPAVWSGTELLIWQHGLTFDPVTDTWRTMPTYPGPRRISPATVWTGREIIVWGGCDASIPQCDDSVLGHLTDGSIYDVASNTWRSMTDSPLAPGAHPVGVFAEEGVFFYAGKTDATASGAQVARYDLGADTWTEVEPPPIEPRRYAAGAWTSAHFVLWGGERTGETWFGDGAAFDPNTGLWSMLPDPPAGSERDRHTMIWANDHLYIVGGWSTNGPITFTPQNH